MRLVGRWVSLPTLCLASMCSCGGSGESEALGPASASSATASGALDVPLVVGPGTGTGHTFNRPRISVDICSPGDASRCQRIDHVIVDSGSTGLRLARSALDPLLLAALPAKRSGDGRAIAECARFATTYVWGTLQVADVRLGSRVASAALVHVVDEGGAVAPDDCTHQGDWSRLDLAAESSNGIIGLGSMLGDEGRYYVCRGAVCDASAMALPGVEGLVRQPVSLLDADRNGYVVELPAAPEGRSASITGRLVLGLGTRADNQVDGQAVFALDAKGSLGPAMVDGRDLGPLVLDTGLAYHWFDDDRVATCPGSGYYCPAASLTRLARVREADGRLGELPFDVVNADQRLAASSLAVYDGLAHRRESAPGAAPALYLGLPFFFGRRVYLGLPEAAARTSQGTVVRGPFIAIGPASVSDPDRLTFGAAVRTDASGRR